MVTAVRAVTGDASFYLLSGSDAQSDGPAAGPAIDNTATDNPSTVATATTAAPRRTDRQHKPAAEYWKVPPAAPGGGLNERPQIPLCTASVSQCRWPPREAEAGGIVCSLSSWAMACHCSARDTPCYPEAAQCSREGAGPTAPWDGPSFWAAGTSASRGVALLFKACLLLSEVLAYAADPCGRCIAAQGTLSGSHVTMASVYAPVERQERAPFFQQSLLPAMPIGTPLLLRGDWNCEASQARRGEAEDLDLVEGQPGTRQHGFQLLPFQQALSLQDAFRCLHPQARELTHTATNNASSARIDRWLVSDSLLPNVSAASVTDLILSDHYGVAASVSPANASPRGPGLSSMPPAIVSHAEFKARMTAQIQTFLQANPVTTTLSRAARWDKLKVDIQDVARNYCSTFHAQRTGKLRVLSCEQARLERPVWLLQAVIMPWMHCWLRKTELCCCQEPLEHLRAEAHARWCHQHVGG